MKILIIGQNASGKTTLAKKICDEKGIPFLEIDDIWHAMDIPSINRSDKEVREKINDHLLKEIGDFVSENRTWVCDGFYASALKPAADAADVIIHIDIPLLRRQINHIKRMLMRNSRAQDFSIFQNLHFLYRMIRRTRRTEIEIDAFLENYQEKTLHLKTYREVDISLEQLIDK